MNIAVIPARGGSKRIPRKNIKSFAGKPMIAYAIQTALESGLFDRVIVTTDDDEIANVSKKYGAEVPFSRPIELADDHTPTVPVIAHAIEACEALGWDISAVCCIYACVPFIQSDDLRGAFALLEQENDGYAFPVTEFSSAIQRALKRDRTGAVRPFFPEYELVRTQDLETAYHDAGQFYWGWRESWFKYSRIHSHGTGLIIPNWRVVDIDTTGDWLRAELFHKAINIK